MAFLLSCQEITKSYGARPLFTGITLGIEEGDRLGLIGPNGSGKSTLLRILAGLEPPDSGVVSGRRGLRIGYVGQEEDLPPDATVEEVLRFAARSVPLEEHERETQLAITLNRFGFADGGQLVGTLSGGWRKRLALAREMIREPDLLLLDEPTNHLDLQGIRWLEQTLLDAPFALVVVTHDRYFLEGVTTRIVELSGIYPEGRLSSAGTYSDFLTKREEVLRGQAQLQEALAGKVQREVEWLRRGARARGTKSSARIQAASNLIADLQELKRRSRQDQTAAIDFTASGRKTRELIVAKGLEVSLGGRALFSGLDVTVSPRTRLGLIGPNGGGKTTLLRVLCGELQPDRGRLRQAEWLKVAYYGQNREQLDLGMRLREALAPAGDIVIYRGRELHVITWAKRFLFSPDDLDRRLDQFSGGEQARVLLARFMLREADVLLLDEPTNDLDIPTLEVLEESLQEFPGGVVLVTHDRYLLDRLATQVLAVGGLCPGYYADFRQWEARTEELEAQAAAPKRRSDAPRDGHRSGLTTSEERELGKMERRIEAAEEEVRLLQRQLEAPEVASDHLKLQELWESLHRAQERVAELYQRWEYLEAKRAEAAR